MPLDHDETPKSYLGRKLEDAKMLNDLDEPQNPSQDPPSEPLKEISFSKFIKDETLTEPVRSTLNIMQAKVNPFEEDR